MTRRLLVVFALLCMVADVARAQIIQSVRRFNPLAWTSLSIGWLQQQGLCDPDSGACWDFGSAPQWRASLELPKGQGASFGVAATMSRLPLIYSSGLATGNSCLRCDADANVTQIMGQLHLGGSTGFHQVIDIGAGMTMFSNFRERTGGTRLGDGKTKQDFSFSIGYGFGYALSPRAQIMLVQDYGLIIHKRQPGESNNTAQQSNLRVGVRFGLGDKR